MAAAGITQLPLCDEDRACTSPTAARVLDLLEPNLSPLQEQILDLLDIPISPYGTA